MTDGEFVSYLPPPEKILELYEKLDKGVVLGTSFWVDASEYKIGKVAVFRENERRL